MISVNNITKEFGGEPLFEGITFNINPKDRIGLAGANGAGKSTLLKIMCNLLSAETGKIVIPKNLSVGYLPQEKQMSSELSVFDEVMKAFSFLDELRDETESIHAKLSNNNFKNEKEYSRLIERLEHLESVISIYSPDQLRGDAERYLMGLGYKRDDLFRPMTEFSQGWQMRVEIAKLLLIKPGLLLLDEPTNHLDIESIQWVEDFLKTYPGSVLIVSHDRSLLDNVTTRTIEISNGKAYDYKVPYSEYISLRAEREDHLKSTYNNQQKEIDEIENFVERFRYKASKAKQVQSRVKLLEKMERIELDNVENSSIHFLFPPAPHSGKVTLDGKAISKSYDDNLIIDKIDFEILKGEKVAFLGRNGEGKSTLAKIIAGILDYTGELKLGHQVITGYYAQDQADRLDPDLTVYETIDNVAVGDVRKRITSILGAFLFQGEDIHKKIKVLSGGEKSRLSLALLLLQPCNLLLLDEPTNHLDMRSKDILKNALLQFDGTLVIVSHDRDFLQGLTSRMYEFRDRGIKEFRGDIESFLEKKRIRNFAELERKAHERKQEVKSKSDNKLRWEAKKEVEKKIRKMTAEVEKAELEIERIENEINDLSNKMSDTEKYKEELKSGKLYKQHQELNDSLSDKYDLWETLQQKLESLKAELPD